MKRFWHKISRLWTTTATVGARGTNDADYREVHAQEQARTQLNADLRSRTAVPHI